MAALQIRIISKCSTWGQPPFLALSCLHCAQRDEIKSVLLAAECRRDPNLLICWDSFCSRLTLGGMLALLHNYLDPQTLRLWVITNYVVLFAVYRPRVSLSCLTLKAMDCLYSRQTALTLHLAAHPIFIIQHPISAAPLTHIHFNYQNSPPPTVWSEMCPRCQRGLFLPRPLPRFR